MPSLKKSGPLFSDDIQYQFRDIIGNKNYQMPDSHIRETSSSYSLSTNRLIDEELSYHFVQLLHETSLSSTLNSDQVRAFNCIIDRVHDNKPSFFLCL